MYIVVRFKAICKSNTYNDPVSTSRNLEKEVKEVDFSEEDGVAGPTSCQENIHGYLLFVYNIK